ncbi:MAG: methyl-accepting chemotaxis protein [Aliivibrio sp.]|uniref:methyl-accepting chemotaxis protein n=1 Tax=Aliivibrio sp. TaxID=1872443 RepID=UPI001A5CB39E|nr:methyl-accepting chemotaxis protein [Aliivibrio sp.]
MSFKGKIFALFGLIVVLAIITSYMSANYYISHYIYESSVYNTQNQLKLVRDKLSGDIKNIEVLAKNIDTGSAGLDELEKESGFYRINKVIQGMVFTDHGTETDPAITGPLLKSLADAQGKLTISDIMVENGKSIISVVIPGENGRGNLFFYDLSSTKELLKSSTAEGTYLELKDAAGTTLFSNKVAGDLIQVDHKIEVGDKQWLLTGYIDKTFIQSKTNGINQSITIALIASGLLLMVISIVLVIIAYRPIENLRVVVTDLAAGEGDLTRRLEVKSTDDLGQIADGINKFTQSLQELMLAVANSSNQLGEGVEHIKQNANLNHDLMQTHVQESEQAMTAVTEMSATADSVAESALSASKLTQESTEQAESCKQLVQQSVATINDLVVDVDSMSDSIVTLNDDISEIANVLSVIGGIAEQTNLLALNAAIEAARAGEQGRGFAVVADEVRTLADQTQKSTKEINEMLLKLQSGTTKVEEAMHKTKEGCSRTTEAAEKNTLTLDTMIGSIVEINAINAQIATAAEEQSVTTNEIARNMTSIQSVVVELEQNGVQTQQRVVHIESCKSDLGMVVNHFKLS